MKRPEGLSWLLLLAAVAGGAYWFGQRRGDTPAVPEAAPGTLLADGQTVVTAVRQLARLETVSFHMERLIDLKQRQSRLFGLLEADDAILLVAAGDVVAGIDLSAMAPDAIEVEAATASVTVTLPAPVLLLTRLDNARTYVYRRKTALLAAREERLETRARELAERELGRAALEAGILDAARTGADAAIRSLLMQLGFKTVYVSFDGGADR